MDFKNKKERQEYLRLLRDTLSRIERSPDPYFNEAAHVEFKNILTTRIALLERIDLLEDDLAEAPPSASGFRVQVHIRGVEIMSYKHPESWNPQA